MEKTYQPAALEQALYDRWEAAGYFEPAGDGDPFCIVIPPPNVTGSLHMGHAFEHALMDTLVRYQRMRGRRTLWQMGTDHAGIATQMLVERQLQQRNLDRETIGREAFLEHVWQWKAESGGQITRQMRRIGSSVAWNSERFTMDDGFSKTVREAFVRLHEQGLIYRGTRLVNWDPVLKTAISDLEVENKEENGSLWHLRYPLRDGRTTADGAPWLVVATTRPETMLGDTAVAVHPEDARYRDLIGAEVELPLTGRSLTIIADDYVDPEFGTGCVKITPAHDFNDYEVGLRHGLAQLNIFTREAKLVDSVPAPYRGMDRFVARKQIVKDLEALDLVERIDPHKLMQPRGDRSGAVIEPYLTEQWFVATRPLADKAIEVVESGAIEFIPKNRENLYFAWMRDIQDWCISRQQWWGHRIPAWYDPAGHVYVGRSEAEVRATNALADEIPLRQDDDVLETWFSSGCWTFGTLGWPESTEALSTYHPTDVLITGHDIIFFWVARMIMLTCNFCDEVPFRKVYIHGLIRDADGQKMSKSKGNGIDPLDLIDGIELEALVAKRTDNLMQPQMARRIEKATRKDFPNGIPAFGTDALRFTLCRQATQGTDVNLDLKRIEGYRNFCNKLWNAANFVLTNVEGEDCGFDADTPPAPGLADRWLLHRLDEALDAANLALETYRYNLYAKALYEFVWNEYCDWYLELVKPVFWSEDYDDADRIAARHTLLQALETVLRALHPVMPFITETLWQRLRDVMPIAGETIMLAAYPLADPARRDDHAAADIEWLKGLILAARTLRGERGIPPATEIPLLLAGGGAADRERLEAHGSRLRRLARIGSIEWLQPDTTPPPSALTLSGELEVRVPLAGLIDVDAELARIGREIERREDEIRRLNGKLGNEKFVANAPAEVVGKEREKLREAESALQVLTGQRSELESLSA